MQRTLFVLIVFAVGAGIGMGNATNPRLLAQSVEEEAVRKAVEEYVAAFNAADAKKLASLWTPQAVYINPLSGEQVTGRAAIEEQFAQIFKDSPGARLVATTESVRLVSPSVALETGWATVALPGEESGGIESSYSAVYVNRDGSWLLDRVTEEDLPVILSNYEQLKDLEWMIGSWIDQDENATVVTTCSWTKNRNFITRFYTLTAGEQVQMSGLQIVGWDPLEKRIRSWIFDSDGSFGEGVWTKSGNAWHIRSAGTLPDGQRSSSLNILTYINDDSFTWQSVNRDVGGEILPNVDEVLVVRQPVSN